jgi:hypothetical protein
MGLIDNIPQCQLSFSLFTIPKIYEFIIIFQKNSHHYLILCENSKKSIIISLIDMCMDEPVEDMTAPCSRI